MDTIKINKKQVKIIAHKGVSGLECENTIPAFVAAGNRSYYGIETDVHVTKDNKFVIFHDDTMYRMTGVGNVYVEKTDLKTLRSFPLISPIPGDAVRQDLRVPTLEEYISVCKKYQKIAVLELKNHMLPEHIEKMVAVIRNMRYLEGVLFISFDWDNMLTLRKLLPKQKLQFLPSKYTDDLIEKLKGNNIDLDIAYRELDAEKLQALHAAGIEVNCWTVDDPKRAEELVEMGVDYITSNILE